MRALICVLLLASSLAWAQDPHAPIHRPAVDAVEPAAPLDVAPDVTLEEPAVAEPEVTVDAALPTPDPFARLAFEPAPVVGVEGVIVVLGPDGDPDPGETVQVMHRPDLDGERQIAIGITDSRGRVLWTPELAGVAIVRAGDDALPVHIAWTTIPTTTALLLGLLGLAGVGALGYGLFPRRARSRRRP